MSIYHSDICSKVEIKEFRAKGTDSIEYAHCVWKVNDYPKFTKLRII